MTVTVFAGIFMAMYIDLQEVFGMVSNPPWGQPHLRIVKTFSSVVCV